MWIDPYYVGLAGFAIDPVAYSLRSFYFRRALLFRNLNVCSPSISVCNPYSGICAYR